MLQIEKMTGKHITELFDWIVGTSVGGVLALGIVYGMHDYTLAGMCKRVAVLALCVCVCVCVCVTLVSTCGTLASTCLRTAFF